MKNGGPAFPLQILSDKDSHCEGMTMRQYYKAMALQIFSIEEAEMAQIEKGLKPRHKLVAKFCGDLADAMLQEDEGAGK